jgi:hypothetical protein
VDLRRSAFDPIFFEEADFRFIHGADEEEAGTTIKLTVCAVILSAFQGLN